jgi:D-tyrosyl-tRNA(Tyr) deacylase
MIGLIQRVKHAKVTTNGEMLGSIQAGILLLLGVEKNDDIAKVHKLAKKITNLRIFPDENDKMNLSLIDTKSQLLVVSQFTLVATTAKGNRPGFSNCAEPSLGESLYNEFINHYTKLYGPCQSGRFGANMQITLVNDGPTTFYLTA